jgi:adhesin transport system membrane fusion protein
MPSNIKFSAYDYTIYGTFPGQVLNISADTFEDENTRDTQPYYKVLVEVDPSAIEDADGEIIIRSGMLVDAELQVGQKTVLQYILTPLFKTTEAFREP